MCGTQREATKKKHKPIFTKKCNYKVNPTMKMLTIVVKKTITISILYVYFLIYLYIMHVVHCLSDCLVRDFKET